MARRAPWLSLLLAHLAFARAGGGELFDSGGGGGGDGDGIFTLIFFIIRMVLFLIQHPILGTILIVVAVVWFLKQRREDQIASDPTLIAKRETDRRTHVNTGIDQLVRARDAAFDEASFIARVRTYVTELQDAWFARELSKARRFLSDATYQRFNVQLDLMRRAGLRDAVTDFSIERVELLAYTAGAAFDQLDVKLSARARDADAPHDATDEQARSLAQKAPLESFVEVWSFVRRSGLQTNATWSDHACPSCGAPFAGGAANRCEHCGAIVNSGLHDWVLAEITQGNVYARPSREPVEGLAAAQLIDPALTAEALEDRASLIFWKWVQAQTLGRPELFAKVAKPETLAALKTRVFTDCAVGAANLLSVRLEGEVEIAEVELVWSAQIDGVPAPHRSVLVMHRAADAHTNEALGLSCSRCGQCGAPLSDNGETRCEFCGAELTSGAHDWLITRLLKWEAWQVEYYRGQAAAQAAPQAPNAIERERLLKSMLNLARTDGVIDARELKLLRHCAREWQVPWSVLDEELRRPLPPPEDTAGVFHSIMSPSARGPVEREFFFRGLVEMAKADGEPDKREREMLERAAHRLGLADRFDELVK